MKKIRIPKYITPRLKWREAIHAALLIKYGNKTFYTHDREGLELEIILYLSEREIIFHDLDNRLKDIMDTLQGRIGGSKKLNKYFKFIENDSQIYKVNIVKKLPPKQSKGFGHLTIRKLRSI